MKIRLSDHFTYGRLLRFTFPSVIMLVFTSIYGVVDGFFVSNFAGKTPFAAVNFIMPLLMILGCAGFMFGRRCADRADAGRGRPGKGQPAVFADRLHLHRLRGSSNALWFCMHSSHCVPYGCGREASGRQCPVWEDRSGGASFLCAAV